MALQLPSGFSDGAEEIGARALLSDAERLAGARAGTSAWKPPNPEDVADIVEGCRIDSLLGRGGMGAVYRARRIDSGQPVAIKLLPPELAADERFAAALIAKRGRSPP
jgi:hypothetical protein